MTIISSFIDFTLQHSVFTLLQQRKNNIGQSQNQLCVLALTKQPFDSFR